MLNILSVSNYIINYCNEKKLYLSYERLNIILYKVNKEYLHRNHKLVFGNKVSTRVKDYPTYDELSRAYPDGEKIYKFSPREFVDNDLSVYEGTVVHIIKESFKKWKAGEKDRLWGFEKAVDKGHKYVPEHYIEWEIHGDYMG